MVSAAIALFIGAFLQLFVDFDNFDTSEASSPEFISSVLYLLGAMVLLLALVRLYTEEWRSLGGFGRLAFAIAFIGGVLVIGALWADFFVYPYLADEAPTVATEDPSGWLIAGFLIYFGLTALGWLLLGIALLRSRVVAGWVGALLSLGAVVSLVPAVGGLVFFAAIGVLGYHLSKGTDPVRGRRPPDSPVTPSA
jgi:hypothetical protein